MRHFCGIICGGLVVDHLQALGLRYRTRLCMLHFLSQKTNLRPWIALKVIAIDGLTVIQRTDSFNVFLHALVRGNATNRTDTA